MKASHESELPQFQFWFQLVFHTEADLQLHCHNLPATGILLLGDTSIDETSRSRMNRTLLIHAVVNENVYLVDYLISAGCDLTITDCHDKTAMDYALESGNNELIALVREATDNNDA